MRGLQPQCYNDMNKDRQKMCLKYTNNNLVGGCDEREKAHLQAGEKELDETIHTLTYKTTTTTTREKKNTQTIRIYFSPAYGMKKKMSLMLSMALAR